ncbi:hypothetical protein AB833_00955 [Chromatiales bacterium (ex Bugula neritina AB1)]|nr:hypothetical protein AB833_00955 [Chromatiales bacterium (ex Bugula neritina AB1)]
MAKSLQDQLLKAGLANKKQAVRARKAKNSKEKLQRAGITVDDESALLVQQAEQKKLEKDRELNRLKTEKADLAAIQAQIKQIIGLNRITERGDIEFRFPEGTLVKTLLVSEQQRAALISGAIAIVKYADDYNLVPRKVALKIAERDPSKILLCNENTADEDTDDEYADYQVPDDLMW